MRLLLLLTILALPALAQQPADLDHRVAAMEQGKFNGWPANNGVWQWDNEILVGFTQGDYVVSDSHNITGIQESHFARSLDGGETWTAFDPENFLDDDNIQWKPAGKKRLTESLNFHHEGFAIRVFATGYHGNDDPEGGFYYSYDRGATWQGPWFLGDLKTTPEFANRNLTPRTDYIVTGPKEAYFFISSNDPGEEKGSRIACVKTTDGAVTFEFVSWITPYTQDYRAIMSQTIQADNGDFICSFRRINVDKSVLESTIDIYHSADQGKTWRFRSTVTAIKENSNPPALVQLADGRLCCIYGDRDAEIMAGKYSSDLGKTWGDEFTIRDNYKSLDGWADMGYPRLVQRPDGKLVAMYYWATAEQPEHFIAATTWTP